MTSILHISTGLVILLALTVLPTNAFMSEPASLGLSTVAGTCGQLSGGLVNGPATAAKFDGPTGVAMNSNGTLIAIADDLNNQVRQFSNDAVDTLAGRAELGFGDGTGTTAIFRRPVAVSISSDGTWAAVADRENSLIRRISIPDGIVTSIAGMGFKGFADGTAAEATFNTPIGVAISPDDSWIAVADSGNHAIRRVDVTSGQTGTVAGSVPGLGQGSQGFQNGHATDEGRLNTPKGVAFSPDGAWLAISDSGNRAVRALSLGDGSPTLSTWAGGAEGLRDGSAGDALFGEPLGLGFAPDGGAVYVADGPNGRVRVVVLEGGGGSEVWSLNGTGGLAGSGFEEFLELLQPSDVAVSRNGFWMVVSLSEGNCLVNISTVRPSPPLPTTSPPYEQRFSAVVYANAQTSMFATSIWATIIASIATTLSVLVR